MENTVIDRADSDRFELEVNGQKVFADYRRENKVIYILHVEAPPELRGTGAAGQFMQGMMEHIRKQGLKVCAICPYAVAWLARHREFQDITVNK